MRPYLADHSLLFKPNPSQRLESAWYARLDGRLDPPAEIRDWLIDPGSLTRRLQSACDGRFRVELHRQTRSRPLRSEAERLQLRHAAVALLREVYLHCDEQPWVFARTLIPLSSLRGAARRLTRLGNRPLGALLFADPSAERGDMEFSRLRSGDSLYEAAAVVLPGRPAQLWGRRTLFRFAGKPLLVNEIFLPNLPTRERADDAIS
jgi:chorismate--pyruvate lyase